jgi:hypothetical protein
VHGVFRIGVAIIITIIISFGWFFIPRINKLFIPLQFGEDPWISWGIIAAVTWSIIAVPLSIAAVVVFVFIKQRKDARSSNIGKNY